MDPRLCLALDLHDRERLLALARATSAEVGMFKVGLTSYVSLGPAIVGELATMRDVFLDLKFHDIPDQVRGAVAAAARTGARLTTVHALGGRAMIEAATAAADDDVKVLAVTILTSLDAAALSEIGLPRDPGAAAVTLADVAIEAGASGLVCSPREVGALRERFGATGSGGPLLVVPGIRPPGAAPNDQKRTLGPAEAIAAGADVLVVGRPIAAASDPAAAARTFLAGAPR